MTVKYTPQWIWLKQELENVDREKTPWLIVLMHAPIYNSNNAHFLEGESMRVVFEAWFCKYKVDIIFAGHVHAYERSVCLSHSLGFLLVTKSKTCTVIIMLWGSFLHMFISPFLL